MKSRPSVDCWDAVRSVPPSCLSIFHILRLVAWNKMLRINATRVVAGVSQVIGRCLPIMQAVGNAMSKFNAAVDSDLAVAVLVF